MHARTYPAAMAIAALLAFGLGTDASAATYTIEPGTVALTGVDGCIVAFSKKDCELQGTIKGGSFDLTSDKPQATLNDLFNWEIVKTSDWAVGGGDYTVSATLNFSSPSDVSSGPNGGTAWFLTGVFSLAAGELEWKPGINTVEFGDGSKISYDLHDAFKFGYGTSAKTGATFTLVQGPAPVPLPASALLLLAGVGAIGGLRARKSRKAA